MTIFQKQFILAPSQMSSFNFKKIIIKIGLVKSTGENTSLYFRYIDYDLFPSFLFTKKSQKYHEYKTKIK